MHCFGVFIVNFQHITNIALVFRLLMFAGGTLLFFESLLFLRSLSLKCIMGLYGMFTERSIPFQHIANIKRLFLTYDRFQIIIYH